MPERLLNVLQAVFPFLLSLTLIIWLRDRLPKDLGRDFAFNGKLTAGKSRGAGLLFVIAFVASSLLFVTPNAEYILYSACVFVSMMSGYLDDRSDKPWNEYIKGLADLIICALTAWVFVANNKPLCSLSLFGWTTAVPQWLFVFIGTAFLWLMINAVNCSDGIDGYSGSLSINSMLFIIAIGASLAMDGEITDMCVIMIFVLLPYLWFNAEPNSMMMGDAGSRALGIFIGLALMKTGNILLAIPLCLVFLIDGLLGILKVSLKRFLKISILVNIRTPIHDHLRKNMGWSNTQTIYRLNLIQALISTVTLYLIK